MDTKMIEGYVDAICKDFSNTMEQLDKTKNMLEGFLILSQQTTIPEYKEAYKASKSIVDIVSNYYWAIVAVENKIKNASK